MNELKVRDHVDVTVVEIPEHLVFTSAPVVLARISRSIEQDRPDIILDLSRCSLMDSGGLGQIVECWRECQKAGGALKLLGPLHPRIQRKFNITGLEEIFEIFDSESEATKSFR